MARSDKYQEEGLSQAEGLKVKQLLFRWVVRAGFLEGVAFYRGLKEVSE